uniref:Uncharacterized protein n=1 Tax=Oryza punctata TaxID=4537 RepID=A0A0E0KZY8_ORYPU
MARVAATAILPRLPSRHRRPDPPLRPRAHRRPSPLRAAMLAASVPLCLRSGKNALLKKNACPPSKDHNTSTAQDDGKAGESRPHLRKQGDQAGSHQRREAEGDIKAGGMPDKLQYISGDQAHLPEDRCRLGPRFPNLRVHGLEWANRDHISINKESFHLGGWAGDYLREQSQRRLRADGRATAAAARRREMWIGSWFGARHN